MIVRFLRDMRMQVFLFLRAFVCVQVGVFVRVRMRVREAIVPVLVRV